MHEIKRRGRPPGSKKKNVVELSGQVNYNEPRKIKVQFELEIKISSVKVIEWGEVS